MRRASVNRQTILPLTYAEKSRYVSVRKITYILQARTLGEFYGLKPTLKPSEILLETLLRQRGGRERERERVSMNGGTKFSLEKLKFWMIFKKFWLTFGKKFEETLMIVWKFRIPVSEIIFYKEKKSKMSGEKLRATLRKSWWNFY